MSPRYNITVKKPFINSKGSALQCKTHANPSPREPLQNPSITNIDDICPFEGSPEKGYTSKDATCDALALAAAIESQNFALTAAAALAAAPPLPACMNFPTDPSAALTNNALFGSGIGSPLLNKKSWKKYSHIPTNRRPPSITN